MTEQGRAPEKAAKAAHDWTCETHGTWRTGAGRRGPETKPWVPFRLIGPVVALILLAAFPLPAQEVHHEEITVERVVVDVHVVDPKGNPIEGLRPTDFKVTIDGLPATVESIEWVDSRLPYSEGLTPEEAAATGAPEVPRGRLIVIFFQTDFQRDRVKGQLKITTYALGFLDTLTEYDRVAVVSYDSHLKLRQDFTSDKAKLERAIRDSVLINDPPPPEVVANPSMFRRIDQKEARAAATPEKALFLIGNALLPVEGPKTLVLFGWGLGRYGATGVRMIHDYGLAKIALEASRTSVFSIDISEADYHSLEVGLGKVSADTGGFYAKTNVFPQMAMDRLERVISGHYVLVLKKPETPRGTHSIDIQLRGRKGEVMARSTYQD